MTVTIDRAGRIVVPKPVRDRLGLKAGSSMELAESPDGILLIPENQSPPLVNRNGLLVHRGKLPKGLGWDRLVEDDREERLRKQAGL